MTAVKSGKGKKKKKGKGQRGGCHCKHPKGQVGGKCSQCGKNIFKKSWKWIKGAAKDTGKWLYNEVGKPLAADAREVAKDVARTRLGGVRSDAMDYFRRQVGAPPSYRAPAPTYTPHYQTPPPSYEGAGRRRGKQKGRGKHQSGKAWNEMGKLNGPGHPRKPLTTFSSMTGKNLFIRGVPARETFLRPLNFKRPSTAMIVGSGQMNGRGRTTQA